MLKRPTGVFKVYMFTSLYGLLNNKTLPCEFNYGQI